MTTTFTDALNAVAAGATPEDAAAALVATMTPEERLWCLDGDLPGMTGLAFIALEDGYHRAPFIGAAIERIGLPGIAFSDGPRGCVVGNATCFPVSMARGATWDPDLEERVGEAIGIELRASGADLTGAVCINLLRHPAWGRAQETYGEDPFHVGEMGAALTRGLQRHVMACVKHFACNSMENARFKVDVEIDDVALHEVFLPHFRRVVDEGVASVMSAYNRVNGDWAGESRALLTDVLRGEWGFDGYVISDWVFGLRDAGRSLHGGLDIEMPARLVRAHHLAEALDRGEVTWDEVDTAAQRLIATLLRFDAVLSSPTPPHSAIGTPEHRALAREVAERSIVLLRNEPVGGTPALPIEPTAEVAVIGRLAAMVNVGDAGSSDVWDLDCVPVLDGLRAAFDDVVYDDGSVIDQAVGAAAGADAAVVVVGYTRLDEGEFMGGLDDLPTEVFSDSDEPEVVAHFEQWKQTVAEVQRPERFVEGESAFGLGGDRSSLRLPAAEVELIRAVAAANSRTIVVIQAGSAVLCSEWVGDVAAVVQAWYGGAQAGPALAAVLTGSVDPSGRLPFSVPADESHLPDFDSDAQRVVYDRWHGWWNLERLGHQPTFPFGFGLSYSDLSLGGVDVVATGTGYRVTGSIGNSGDRDASDVVQVYAKLPVEDRPPRLVGFTRTDVPAGSTITFEIHVPSDRLAIRDTERRAWEQPVGTACLTVARHSGEPAAPSFAIDL